MIVTTYYLSGLYDKKVTTISDNGVVEIALYLTPSEQARLAIVDVEEYQVKQSWLDKLINIFRKK